MFVQQSCSVVPMRFCLLLIILLTHLILTNFPNIQGWHVQILIVSVVELSLFFLIVPPSALEVSMGLCTPQHPKTLICFLSHLGAREALLSLCLPPTVRLGLCPDHAWSGTSCTGYVKYLLQIVQKWHCE